MPGQPVLLTGDGATAEARAGPSKPSSVTLGSPSTPVNGDGVTGAHDGDLIEIPSFGLEFFEYRRRLFLAGLPLPATPSSSTSIPPTYLVPPAPPPLSVVSSSKKGSTSEAVRRLESLLEEEGSEELQETWDCGVDTIARHLHAGKKLAKGLRLGLVIKILKASWIRDGLWPTDARTGKPSKPPDSPVIAGVDLFPQNGKE